MSADERSQSPVSERAKAQKSVRAILTDAQFAYILIIPVLIVLVVFYAFPIGYSFWLSLNRFNPTMGPMKYVGFSQYSKALHDPAVWNAAYGTALFTILVTFIALFVSLGSALVLNERFRGRAMLLAIVVLPWALSTYMAAVVWRHLVSQQYGLFNGILLRLGLIDSYVAFITPVSALLIVALAQTWQIAPLGIFFFLASLSVIPSDLYRVGRLDRLGVFGRFRYVTWPYLRTAVLIIMVIVSVEAGRAFDIIYFLTQGGPGNSSTTLTWQIYHTTFTAFNIGYGAVISYVLVAWIIVVTTIYFFLMFKRSHHEAT